MTEEVKDTANTNPSEDPKGVVEETTQPEGTESAEESAATQGAPEQKPQPQSKEENARYAAARREKEAKEREIKAEQKGVIDAIIKYVKINPHTQKPILTAEDVERFKKQEDLKAKGKDPNADYAEELEKEAREREQFAAQQAERQAKIDSDIAEFNRTYPDVGAKSLLEDEMFLRFCGSSIGDASLTTLYKEYQSLRESVRQEEKAKLIEKAVQKQDGVGSLIGGNENQEITKAQFRRMSVDERTELFRQNPTLFAKLSK